MEERLIKGYNGNMIISDAGVAFSRGAKGFLTSGSIRGEKTIPWESIIAVQYKKAGMSVGYLQLSIRGGSESKAGVLEAAKDENTLTWMRASRNKEFAELRDFIQERISGSSGGTKVCPECAEEVKAAAKVCRFCGSRFDSA